MFFLGHNLAYLVNILFCFKSDQLFPAHKEFDWHTLVDQTGCCISIVIRCNQYAMLLLCHFYNRFRNLWAAGDHNTACIGLQCTDLSIITVSHDNQIIILQKLFHGFRICRANHYFSFHKVCMLIATQHSSVQCIHNILILCLGTGQNTVIIYIHIRSCNITCNDQTLKIILLIRHR